MTPLFSTFKTRAEAVSAEVHHCSTKVEALSFILAFLREQTAAAAHPARAVWAAGSLLAGVDRRVILERSPGLTFDVTRETAEAAWVIGISEVECAISETGTLVTDAGPVERRLVSSLPVIHLAIAATDSIQFDMRPRPSRKSVLIKCGYISMITGPAGRPTSNAC